jgi:ribonuclease Z
MEIVFLGTSGSIPAQASGNVSFVIRIGEGSLLVDVSGNPVQSLLKVGIDPLTLDALVLTHAHTDHLYALPSLFHALWMMHRRKALTLFANPHTEQKARELLRVFGLEERPGLFPYRFISLPPEPISMSFPLDNDAGLVPEATRPELLFFPVLHSVPTHGFLLRALGRGILYTSDTAPLPAWVADTVDVLIHEASGEEKDEESLNLAGHSSGRQAGAAAMQLHARELFLCHLPAEPEKAKAIGRDARRGIRESGSRTIIRIPLPFRWYDIFTLP